MRERSAVVRFTRRWQSPHFFDLLDLVASWHVACVSVGFGSTFLFGFEVKSSFALCSIGTMDAPTFLQRAAREEMESVQTRVARWIHERLELPNPEPSCAAPPVVAPIRPLLATPPSHKERRQRRVVARQLADEFNN